MKRLFVLAACAGFLTVSCSTPQETALLSIADLPLTSTKPASFDIEHAPVRAHNRYLLYGTNTDDERRRRLGDYYYVRWYDADPSAHVRLVMNYTQALSRSEPQQRSVEYREPRERAEEQLTRFFFNGEERIRKGDILSWKIELYCNGKLKDVMRSYLWREPGFSSNAAAD